MKDKRKQHIKGRAWCPPWALAVPIIAAAVVACATPSPTVASTEQGVLGTADMFTAMDVVDNGPSTVTIGLVTFGGYSRLSTDLHDLRVNQIGESDIGTLTEKDQRGGTSFPAFDLSGATDAAEMIDGIAYTSPASKVTVIHADSANESDIAAAVDRLRLLGVDVIAGVQQFSGTPSTLQTALAAAHAAGIQVLWSIGETASGTNGYLGATKPQPAAAVDGSGNPVLLAIATTSLIADMSTRGYSETLIQESQSSDNRKADASAPGNGPAEVPTSSTTASFGNVSKSKAFAVGLAAGAFARHLAWKVPSDLTSGGAFFDLKSGSNAASCSPTSICTAQVGQDGVSNWGTPNVAQF